MSQLQAALNLSWKLLTDLHDIISFWQMNNYWEQTHPEFTGTIQAGRLDQLDAEVLFQLRSQARSPCQDGASNSSNGWPTTPSRRNSQAPGVSQLPGLQAGTHALSSPTRSSTLWCLASERTQPVITACVIPSLSWLDPELISLTATGPVTPHDQGGAQQNHIIGKLKDLYRKTNILLVTPTLNLSGMKCCFTDL